MCEWVSGSGSGSGSRSGSRWISSVGLLGQHFSIFGHFLLFPSSPWIPLCFPFFSTSCSFFHLSISFLPALCSPPPVLFPVIPSLYLPFQLHPVSWHNKSVLLLPASEVVLYVLLLWWCSAEMMRLRWSPSYSFVVLLTFLSIKKNNYNQEDL